MGDRKLLIGGERVGTGEWTEVLNTDSEHYGGSGVGNLGSVEAESEPWHVFSHSARLTLPPLGTLWLAPAPIA